MLGAHVSIAGGLENALIRAKELTLPVIQIFSSAPQRWDPPHFPHDQLVQFKEKKSVYGVRRVFIHGCYLINLASDLLVSQEKSVQNIIADMKFAAAIDAQGVIIHLGTHPMRWTKGKRETLILLFKQILNQTPQTVQLIIENSAGGGSKIPSTLEEMASIRDDLSSDRIKFCIDTAHAFAAGYDLSQKEHVTEFLQQLENTLGKEHIAAFHLNDSKALLGSGHDRHENIGEGKIGKTGFAEFVRSTASWGIPWILETPGFEGRGPDEQNCTIVRSLLR